MRSLNQAFDGAADVHRKAVLRQQASDEAVRQSLADVDDYYLQLTPKQIEGLRHVELRFNTIEEALKYSPRFKHSDKGQMFGNFFAPKLDLTGRVGDKPFHFTEEGYVVDKWHFPHTDRRSPVLLARINEALRKARERAAHPADTQGPVPLQLQPAPLRRPG